MRRFWTHLAASILAVLALVAALEISIRTLVWSGVLQSPPPPPSNQFWDSDHPILGVWHQPNVKTVHASECFKIEYATNSIGARDRERTRERQAPRVIVLGDSFAEGWGIDAKERMSDRLEASTGFEHLNLSMSHFSPHQSYLAYREFGGRFSHDAVLTTVVPISDFADMEYRRALKRPGYEYRYRPYLVGEYPDYREINYREGWLQGLLRHQTYTYNALSKLVSSMERREERPKEWTDHAEKPHHSFFHDFSEPQFDRLRYSLELLVEAAEGKRVAVVLVPHMRDFARFQQSKDSPLARRLEEVLAPRGVQVVDLLPEMYERRNDMTKYFLSCDIHWSAEANEVAAEVVRERLGSVFYERRETNEK